MAAKLSVVFYILLCLEVGLVLTLLPWISPFGLSDWGDNFFLLYAAQKTGLYGLQHAISSGWVRGAVTGLGVLNLGVAVWEIAHFRQTVSALEGGAAQATPDTKPETMPSPFAVWATAVLSASYFSLRSGSGVSARWIAFPIGLLFTFCCFHLVARARRVSEAQQIAYPHNYDNARIVALVLGALSTLNVIRIMAF